MKALVILLLSFGISVSGLHILDDLSQLPDPAIRNLIALSAPPSNTDVNDYFCDLPHLNAIQVNLKENLKGVGKINVVQLVS